VALRVLFLVGSLRIHGSPSLGSFDRNSFREVNLNLPSRKQNDTITRKQEKKPKITYNIIFIEKI
jgi:hypothetical protein